MPTKDYGAAILAVLDTEENEPNLKAELEKEGVVPIAPYFGGVGHLAMGKRSILFRISRGRRSGHLAERVLTTLKPWA